MAGPRRLLRAHRSLSVRDIVVPAADPIGGCEVVACFMEEQHEIDLRVFEPVAEVGAGNLWGVDTLAFVGEALGR